MHIVLGQLKLKNVKTNLVQTHYLDENGNVKEVDQYLNKNFLKTIARGFGEAKSFSYLIV